VLAATAAGGGGNTGAGGPGQVLIYER
jgi:hypothetical protein